MDRSSVKTLEIGIREGIKQSALGLYKLSKLGPLFTKQSRVFCAMEQRLRLLDSLGSFIYILSSEKVLHLYNN